MERYKFYILISVLLLVAGCAHNEDALNLYGNEAKTEVVINNDSSTAIDTPIAFMKPLNCREGQRMSKRTLGPKEKLTAHTPADKVLTIYAGNALVSFVPQDNMRYELTIKDSQDAKPNFDLKKVAIGDSPKHMVESYYLERKKAAPWPHHDVQFCKHVLTQAQLDRLKRG